MKKLLIIIALLALIGLIDSAYLSYAALRELPLPCEIFSGCNEVARSPYSKVFGIPLALFGVVFYAGVLVFAGIVGYRDSRLARGLLLALAGIGFLLSVYFLYIQAFKIGAFCIYCIVSAVCATLIAALAILVSRSPVQPALV